MSKDSLALDEIEIGLHQLLSGIKKLRVAEDWVDQYNSPLGKNAHLAAVRRGALVGHRVKGSRRVLVRRAEVDMYIARHRIQPKAKAESDAEQSEADINARAAEILARPPRPSRKRRAPT